jgi:hypothetical protein
MRRIAVTLFGSTLALSASLLLALTALGSSRAAVPAPFAYSQASGFDGGPMSGNWDDGGSGPKGIHLGCIPARHYAMAVPIDNQAGQTITILSVGGTQPHPRIIRRVAVQAWPKPAQNGGMLQIGLHQWSRTPGNALAVPADATAWLQLNFLMDRCALIKRGAHIPISDTLTITYQDATGAQGHQTIPPMLPIILTRASKDAITNYKANPSAG